MPFEKKNNELSNWKRMIEWLINALIKESMWKIKNKDKKGK